MSQLADWPSYLSSWIWICMKPSRAEGTTCLSRESSITCTRCSKPSTTCIGTEFSIAISSPRTFFWPRTESSWQISAPVEGSIHNRRSRSILARDGTGHPNVYSPTAITITRWTTGVLVASILRSLRYSLSSPATMSSTKSTKFITFWGRRARSFCQNFNAWPRTWSSTSGTRKAPASPNSFRTSPQMHRRSLPNCSSTIIVTACLPGKPWSTIISKISEKWTRHYQKISLSRARSTHSPPCAIPIAAATISHKTPKGKQLSCALTAGPP